MVAPLSSQNSALGLLKSANAGLLKNTAIKSGVTPQTQDPMQAVLDKLSPEKADELKKKIDESRDLLKSLQSSRSDMSEERKAAAAEKVRQIKEKLKMIRMMATVNPEAAARQAAQLSRELASAVKQYASASGGAGDATMQAGASDKAAAMGGAENSAAAQSGDAQQAASGIMPQDAAASGAEGEGATQSGDDAAITTQTSDAPDQQAEGGDDGAQDVNASAEELEEQKEEQAGSGDPDSADESENSTLSEKEQRRLELREGIQAGMAQASAAYAASRADSEFANEVRQIKDTLKNILESAKRKMQEGDDPSMDAEIKEGESALRSVEESLNSLSASVIPAGEQIAATAGIAAVNLLA